MAKIDAAILKETKYIAAWVLIFSAVMQAIFLVIGKWDYTVLLGNLLTAVFAVLNFFLMGLSVQKALGKEEKEAKQVMRLSQTYRNIMMLAVVALGVGLPPFNMWAVIIPVFFPRIAISLRPIFDKQ